MKMIVIEEIKMREVPREVVELARYQDLNQYYSAAGNEPIKAEILVELIKGRRFCRHRDGVTEDWFIGYSKQVQDVLQVPMEAFDNLQHDLSTMRSLVSSVKSQLDIANLKNENADLKWVAIASMPWWQRVLFMFTPEKIMRAV